MNKKRIILVLVILTAVLGIAAAILVPIFSGNTDKQRVQNMSQVMIDMAEGRPVKIACYGDSITAGGGSDGLGAAALNYPEHLAVLLSGYYQNHRITVSNCGIGGANSNELVDLWPSSVPKDADLIILMLGTNDSYNQQKKGECDTAQFRENIDKMMRMAGQTPVLFVNTTPRFKGKYKLLGSTVVDQFRKIMEEKADEYQMPCVDVYQRLMDLYDARVLSRSLISQDGSHYQSEGYRHIAEIIFSEGLINEDISVGIDGYKDMTGLWFSDYSENGQGRVVESLALSDYVLSDGYMDLYLYLESGKTAGLAAHFTAENIESAANVMVTNLDIPSSHSNSFSVSYKNSEEGFVQYDYAVPVCELRAGLNRVRFETDSTFAVSGFSIFALNNSLYGQLSTDTYPVNFAEANGYNLSAAAKITAVSEPIPCASGASVSAATLIPNFNEPTGYRIRAYINDTAKIYLGQQANRQGYLPSYIISFQPDSIVFSRVNTNGKKYTLSTMDFDLSQGAKDITIDLSTSGETFSIWIDRTQLYQGDLPLSIGNFVVDNSSGTSDCFINAIYKINGAHDANSIYIGECWVSVLDGVYHCIDASGADIPVDGQ